MRKKIYPPYSGAFKLSLSIRTTELRQIQRPALPRIEENTPTYTLDPLFTESPAFNAIELIDKVTPGGQVDRGTGEERI